MTDAATIDTAESEGGQDHWYWLQRYATALGFRIERKHTATAVRHSIYRDERSICYDMSMTAAESFFDHAARRAAFERYGLARKK